MKSSFTRHAKKRITEVHRLSSDYNTGKSGHTEVLLRLVEKHTIEIKELYTETNGHFAVEVGDLLILCMEILLEQESDLDDILNVCYSRYEKKLKGLILDRSSES